MARAYSGVLGCIAMILVIVRGLVLGLLPDDILTQALVVFFAFVAIGFCIGSIAEKTVYESVENRFRSEMARLSKEAADRDSGSSEQ